MTASPSWACSLWDVSLAPPALSGGIGSVVGRRGRAGDSARAATHSRADRRARRAADRKRYETADGCAKACTHGATFHGARARVSMPASIMFIVSPVIGRVGEPANLRVVLMGLVPLGVVVPDGPVCPVGVQLVHAPAFAVLVAGDVAGRDSFGARCRGNQQGCRARKCEK